MPTITVVGPGAIGASLAACLTEAGRPVTLCGRTRRHEIEVRSDDGGSTVIPGVVHTDPSAVDGPVDVILLAVKGTQVAAARPWLAALAGPATVICILQNGVEQQELVSPHVDGSAVVPAIVWFPAETQQGGWVRLRGRPKLELPRSAEAQTVADIFRGTTCAVELSADFVTSAWHKLLVNAVAGLMVLTGRHVGMYRRADIAGLAEAYLRECLTVARAEGAHLPDQLPGQIVAEFQEYPEDLSSSILADRVAGRPLEWDIRNGVIIRRARHHGIATPISDLLLPLLAASSEGPG